MCVVSNVGDYYARRWPEQYPTVVPATTTTITWPPSISREEFDALKAEVQECKRLLRMAKQIDEALGEPDCEMEEKVELIRRVAGLVGVDLEDIL